MAIILYCPAYAVSGLIAATSHSETLERIPPGASVSIGNPVPCSVYQILASPLSTYGTRVSSRGSHSGSQPKAGPPAAIGIGGRQDARNRSAGRHGRLQGWRVSSLWMLVSIRTGTVRRLSVPDPCAQSDQ